MTKTRRLTDTAPVLKQIAFRLDWKLSYSPDCIANLPTVLRIGGFRFHFYSDDGREPPHIHVANADGECKFWLGPVRLASNRGMKPVDMRHAERLVFEYEEFLLRKFRERSR